MTASKLAINGGFLDPATTGAVGSTVVEGLSAITKPAEALINRVADALGVLYEPRRIVRAAHAEVEADKIRAIGKIEISEIEERVLVLLVPSKAHQTVHIPPVVYAVIAIHFLPFPERWD